jgi:hypothetical protein
MAHSPSVGRFQTDGGLTLTVTRRCFGLSIDHRRYNPRDITMSRSGAPRSPQGRWFFCSLGDEASRDELKDGWAHGRARMRPLAPERVA